MRKLIYISGVLKIINTQKNRAFYLACNNPDTGSIEQKILLEQGKHYNKALQQDYVSQSGKDFLFIIIEKEIDFKAAREIENIWVEADLSSYNNESQ